MSTAGDATDESGLRRWAIVAFGTCSATADGVEVISPKEWSETLLARAFRAAVTQQQLLRENARLRGDLRTIGHRIGHDLRTPLGGILSTGEAVKEELRELDPSRTAVVQPLFDSVEDVRRLIDRVTEVAKASAQPAPRNWVDMGSAAGAALQRLERQLLARRAHVTQPASWPRVEGVAAWLETVWWNLLRNALGHGPEGVRIELGWKRRDPEIIFWIRDDGAGVPGEKAPRLFQPFHLLHQANASRGLGLSIVQRLVTLQGGRCGYEPAAPRGSLFFFTLPAATTAAEPLLSEPRSLPTAPTIP